MCPQSGNYCRSCHYTPVFADARLHLDKSGALRSTTQLHVAAWAALLWSVFAQCVEIVGASPTKRIQNKPRTSLTYYGKVQKESLNSSRNTARCCRLMATLCRGMRSAQHWRRQSWCGHRWSCMFWGQPHCLRRWIAPSTSSRRLGTWTNQDGAVLQLPTDSRLGLGSSKK